MKKRARQSTPSLAQRARLAGSTHVTPRGGNVFADLGFRPQEAANLKLRSELMGEICALIANRELTQVEAGALLGVAQPRVSDLLRGRIDRFTIDALVNMLGRAGVQVELRFRSDAA